MTESERRRYLALQSKLAFERFIRGVFAFGVCMVLLIIRLNGSVDEGAKIARGFALLLLLGATYMAQSVVLETKKEIAKLEPKKEKRLDISIKELRSGL